MITEQDRHVLQRVALAAAEARIGQDILDLERPLLAVLDLHLALDERGEPAFSSSSALPTRSWLVIAMCARPIRSAHYL